LIKSKTKLLSRQLTPTELPFRQLHPNLAALRQPSRSFTNLSIN